MTGMNVIETMLYIFVYKDAKIVHLLKFLPLVFGKQKITKKQTNQELVHQLKVYVCPSVTEIYDHAAYMRRQM